MKQRKPFPFSAHTTELLAIGMFFLSIVLIPAMAGALSLEFGFEPPVYHVGPLQGQDGWVDPHNAGSITDHVKRHGLQSLGLLRTQLLQYARVDRPVGVSVIGLTLTSRYDLLLPQDWLDDVDLDTTRMGAWQRLSVNGSADKYIAFGVAKVGRFGLSPIYGVMSGQAFFIAGDLGLGPRTATFFVRSLAPWLGQWHNFTLSAEPATGMATLYVDDKLVAQVDLGAQIMDVPQVSFEHQYQAVCGPIPKVVYFDGMSGEPPGPEPTTPVEPE